MSFFNYPVLVEVLRKIRTNERLHGPHEVASVCGVAADALEAALTELEEARGALRAFLDIDFSPTFDARGVGAERKQKAVNEIRYNAHKNACDAAMVLAKASEKTQ